MNRFLAVAAAAALLALAVPARAAEKLKINYAFDVADEKAEGGVRRVHADHRFRSGDHFRVVFHGDPATYVYLFARGANDNDYVTLFPREGFRPLNPIKEGTRVTVPGGDTWLHMDEVKGEETFLVVVSTVAIPALDTAGEKVARTKLDSTLGTVERQFAPESTSRERDDHWQSVTAKGPKEMAVVLRLSLRHE